MLALREEEEMKIARTLTLAFAVMTALPAWAQEVPVVTSAPPPGITELLKLISAKSADIVKKPGGLAGQIHRIQTEAGSMDSKGLGNVAVPYLINLVKTMDGSQVLENRLTGMNAITALGCFRSQRAVTEAFLTTLTKSEDKGYSTRARSAIEAIQQRPPQLNGNEGRATQSVISSTSPVEDATRIHARHILIGVSADATDTTRAEARRKAESIRAELLAGKDFAALAEQYSDCLSKTRGGDIGTFRREWMIKPFWDAAFKQKPGEIGPIVETSFGFHIIQVLEP
jgi:parvulin-like peptidyl-prolyl isomerase